MSMKQLLIAIFGVAVMIFVIFLALDSYYVLDADQVVVVQYLTGTLELQTAPGPHLSWWGKRTYYPRRGQFWFSSANDQGNANDQSIKMRFNDGAHGWLSGSAAYELPIGDVAAFLELHTLYSNPQGVEHALIRTVFEKAVYMTGPLMSSMEASAERRNDLLRYVDDQVVYGAYRTYTKDVPELDEMTGKTRIKAITQIQLDKAGNPLRQEDQSPIARFKIRITNLSINSLKFEDRVEAQIQESQVARQQVQIAQSKAKQAEQAAITAAKEGEAKAATAKWEQEVIKAKYVTEAQQKLEVAQLEAKAAEQTKIKLIREGEGEAAKRRLIMGADGALQVKVDAYKYVQERWAEAWAKNGANIVPYIASGGGTSGGTADALQTFLNLQAVQTAKQLGLDLDMKRRAAQD